MDPQTPAPPDGTDGGAVLLRRGSVGVFDSLHYYI